MKKELLLSSVLAAATLFAAPEYRDLPSAYTQVESITTTRSQCFDTGIVVGAGVSAVLDFTPLEYTGENNFGTQAGNDNKDWRFFNYSGGSMFDIGTRRIGYTASPDTKLTNGNRYIVSIGNAYLSITREDGSVKWSGTADPVTDNDLVHWNIYLSANNNNGSPNNFTQMTIYSLVMSNLVGSVTECVRDFVPCVRNSDNEPGLYDLVSGTFFPDTAGSGTKCTVGAVVECPDPVSGILKVGAVSGITPSEATVPVEVRQTTWEGDAVLTLRYGSATNSLPYSVVLDSAAAVGTYEAGLTGLRPGCTWYLVAELAPASGDPITTLAKKFNTAADVTYGTNIAGLLQSRFANKWDTSTDIASQANLGRTLGAMAAHVSTATPWPVYYDNGDEGSAQWGDETTFGYIGYMYLSGDMLTVGAKMDDNVRLVIDGTQVIDQSGNTLKTATYTPTRGAGWYPIEIRVGNGNGGFGPYSGFNGLCWNTTGYTGNDTSANWNTFIDPGDGSLLRTAANLPSPVVEEGWIFASGNLSCTVDCPALVASGELRLYAGETNGLEDTSAWTLVQTVPLAATNETFSVDFSGVAIPAGAKLVRFYLSCPDSGLDASWSKTLSLAMATDPALIVAAPESLTGTSATLVGALANPGLAGDTVVTVILEPAPGSDDGVYTMTLPEAGDCKTNVVDLVPGTTYFYHYEAVNAGDFRGVSPSISFTTPAGSTIVEHGISSLDRTVTVTADIALGAGETTATVRFGPVGGPYADYPATIGADGSLSLDIPGLAWGGKYSYQILIANTETSANGTVYSWSDDTGLVEPAITIYDTVTYTWRGEARGGRDEGDWADRDNWMTDAEDVGERPGYPTDGSRALFDTANAVYRVHIDESVTLAKLYIRAVCDLALLGEGRDATVLYLTDHEFRDGVKLRLDALTFSMRGMSSILEYYITNGGYLDWRGEYFSTHNGTVIDLSGDSEFHGGSENYPGNGGYHFIVDDSVVNIDRCFYHSESSAENSEIVVKGKSPYVYGGMFQARQIYPGNITFSIPVGGYELREGQKAPVYSNGLMNHELWGSYYYEGANVKLDPQSPAIKQQPGQSDHLLMLSGSNFGIADPEIWQPNRPQLFFDNAALPEGCYFYFKDKDGNVLSDANGNALEGADLTTARQLWCHVQGQMGTLILLR